MADWNPRFVQYARAHGETPESMLEYDREHWSGCMVGFILWNGAMLQRFEEQFVSDKSFSPLWTRRDEVRSTDPDVIDAWIEKQIIKGDDISLRTLTGKEKTHGKDREEIACH